MTTVEIEHQPVNDLFVAFIEGDFAGLTEYVERGHQRVFIHTEVRDQFAGHGVATQLIGTALRMTRAQGQRIVAVCPFVAAYVSTHHEFDDILDAVPERHLPHPGAGS